MNTISPTNNWCVITGGPSSGKTTVIDILKSRGYRTTTEEARHYFDIEEFRGIPVLEARENARVLQENILQLQLDLERKLDPHELIFLDRALPDDLAYFKYLELEPDRKLIEALEVAHYHKVFIFDLLNLHRDTVRTEDVASQYAIQRIIVDVYKARPDPVIMVPVLPPEERADFILANL